MRAILVRREEVRGRGARNKILVFGILVWKAIKEVIW